jgi:hypothetical protein
MACRTSRRPALAATRCPGSWDGKSIIPASRPGVEIVCDYPGWEIRQLAGSSLGGGVYPPKDTAYAWH